MRSTLQRGFVRGIVLLAVLTNGVLDSAHAAAPAATPAATPVALALPAPKTVKDVTLTVRAAHWIQRRDVTYMSAIDAKSLAIWFDVTSEQVKPAPEKKLADYVWNASVISPEGEILCGLPVGENWVRLRHSAYVPPHPRPKITIPDSSVFLWDNADPRWPRFAVIFDLLDPGADTKRLPDEKDEQGTNRWEERLTLEGKIRRFGFFFDKGQITPLNIKTAPPLAQNSGTRAHLSLRSMSFDDNTARAKLWLRGKSDLPQPAQGQRSWEIIQAWLDDTQGNKAQAQVIESQSVGDGPHLWGEDGKPAPTDENAFSLSADFKNARPEKLSLQARVRETVAQRYSFILNVPLDIQELNRVPEGRPVVSGETQGVKVNIKTVKRIENFKDFPALAPFARNHPPGAGGLVVVANFEAAPQSGVSNVRFHWIEARAGTKLLWPTNLAYGFRGELLKSQNAAGKAAPNSTAWAETLILLSPPQDAPQLQLKLWIETFAPTGHEETVTLPAFSLTQPKP